MTNPADRRTFLQQSAATVVASAALSTVVASPASAAKGANDTIRVGLIGCGGRGTHVGSLFRATANVEVAYVCDVDTQRRELVAQKLGVPASNVVADMRRILSDKTIDAVIVATPDHWHSPAAILACDAGKHAYVEKPISHNLRESRLLVEAAQRNQVHVQHGTQCRSTPMMIEAVQALREGVIGDVLVAKCWNIQRRGPLPPGKDTDPPAGFDYDSWIGPATMIPYRTNRVHARWTMWHHFGAGEAGNDGVHDLDYTRWGLGVDTHPDKISAQGGKYFFQDEQEFPDTQQITFEYSGDGKIGKRMLIYEQRLYSTNYPHNCDSGAEFYGTKGQMFLSRRGKLEILGDRNKPIETAITAGPQNDALHVKNLCDAIRGEAKLNADALTGHLSTALCHLGNISTRVGRSLQFDPQAEQIVGDDDANKLLRREYREHWGTPKNA